MNDWSDLNKIKANIKVTVQVMLRPGIVTFFDNIVI